MAPPATLTDLFPEQPANHASSHGRRARAVRSLFFGKERAPSESVLGVRAVPLFAENPRRLILGNRASAIPDFRKCNFVLCNALRTARSICYTGQACSASFLEEFFSETQASETMKDGAATRGVVQYKCSNCSRRKTHLCRRLCAAHWPSWWLLPRSSSPTSARVSRTHRYRKAKNRPFPPLPLCRGTSLTSLAQLAE